MALINYTNSITSFVTNSQTIRAGLKPKFIACCVTATGFFIGRGELCS